MKRPVEALPRIRPVLFMLGSKGVCDEGRVRGRVLPRHRTKFLTNFRTPWKKKTEVWLSQLFCFFYSPESCFWNTHLKGTFFILYLQKSNCRLFIQVSHTDCFTLGRKSPVISTTKLFEVPISQFSSWYCTIMNAYLYSSMAVTFCICCSVSVLQCFLLHVINLYWTVRPRGYL